MTEDDALHIRQESTWRLLVELFSSGGPSREHRAVKQVTEGVQELGLQPAQVERIAKSVLEVLQTATTRANQEQRDTPVLIRIWISRAHPEDPAPSNSGAEQGEHRERRGWGFFFVQKHGDNRQASAAEAHQVMELFLYQEELRMGEIQYQQVCAENTQQMTDASGHPLSGTSGGGWE